MLRSPHWNCSACSLHATRSTVHADAGAAAICRPGSFSTPRLEASERATRFIHWGALEHVPFFVDVLNTAVVFSLCQSHHG